MAYGKFCDIFSYSNFYADWAGFDPRVSMQDWDFTNRILEGTNQNHSF